MPGFIEKFPQKYSMLLLGLTGAGKTEFSIELMRYYLERGDRVLFMSTDTDPKKIKERFAYRGMEISKYQDRFIIIDCHTAWKMVTKGSTEWSMDSSPDVKSLDHSVTKTARRLQKNVRVFVDSLSAIFPYNEKQAMLKFVESLCKRTGIDWDSIMFTLHDRTVEPDIVAELCSIVEGLMEMKLDEDLSRYLRFTFMRNRKVDTYWVRVAMLERGLGFEEPKEK